MAGAALILDGGQGSGTYDGKRPVGHECPVGTKRTRVPGANNAAGTRAWSHSTTSVVPINCQPPGEERGYTPVYGPASATEPAGTVVRGVARRGTSYPEGSPVR